MTHPDNPDDPDESTNEQRSEQRARGERAPRFVAAGDRGVVIAAGEVLVRGRDARDRMVQIALEQANQRGQALGDWPDVEDLRRQWYRVWNVPDALDAVDQLRREGYQAEPNYGFGAHGTGTTDGGSGCWCTPCPPHPSALLTATPFMAHPFMAHPFMAHPFMAHPFMAHPFMAHPFMAHPFMAHPFMAHPFMAHPFMAHARPYNTAVPATAPEGATTAALWPPGTAPTVVVLDSGLAPEPHRPGLLKKSTVEGDDDWPDQPYQGPGYTLPADKLLDPIAGHGTFIAGLIEWLAPGATLKIRRVLDGSGMITGSGLVTEIDEAAALDKPDILSLSLGGPTDGMPAQLYDAILAIRAEGTIVVASAGNSATCEPHFPAAFGEVVAVGGLGPDGPAPFTNYGAWVDAAAPATDLTSAYYTDLDPSLTSPQPGVVASEFQGWARWSGTSFAVPIVVAALLREMKLTKSDANGAVKRLLRSEHISRLPGLGVLLSQIGRSVP